MTAAAMALLVIFLFTGLLVYAEVKDNQRLTKLQDQEDAELAAWLVKVKTMPVYCVAFETVDKNRHYTANLEPHHDYLYGMNGIKNYYYYTSQDNAQSLVEQCYKRGYFRDDKGNTYPTCNVTKAYLWTST